MITTRKARKLRVYAIKKRTMKRELDAYLVKSYAAEQAATGWYVTWPAVGDHVKMSDPFDLVNDGPHILSCPECRAKFPGLLGLAAEITRAGSSNHPNKSAQPSRPASADTSQPTTAHPHT